MTEIGNGDPRVEDHFVEATDMVGIGNSGQRVGDHFVDVTDRIEIGKGGRRAVRAVMMSRPACYLVIQNADPASSPPARSRPTTHPLPAPLRRGPGRGA